MMDAKQVTSRAMHDGPDDIIYETSAPAPSTAPHAVDAEAHADGAGLPGDGAADLEKAATAVSTTSCPETYPEGGWDAWLVVLGAWFAMFPSMGLMNTIGSFQSYTATHQLQGYSEGTVGWIFSVYTFLAFFCGVYIGPIFDAYGPKWLVLAGSLCVVVGVVAMSFSYELWHFILSFGVLAGLGTSLLFTPSIAAIGHWFRARRGFATSVGSTAGGIGGIVFPFFLTSLFDRVGFGWATRALALICLCSCLVGIWLVRARLPPAPNASAHPDFRIFRQLPFAVITAGIFMLEFALFIPLTYISSYALHEGFGEDFSYYILPILNAGSVVGRLLPGYYADAVGPLNTCIMSVVLSSVACLCVWLPLGHTTAGIIVFALLFGFGSGTSIAISPVCIGQLCKTQDYGRYYATTYTVVSFACLVGIPIGGSIVQSNGGEYWGLIVFTGVIYLVSMVLLFWAKIAKLGWRGWAAAY